MYIEYLKGPDTFQLTIVQLLSRGQLFVIPCTAAHQSSLFFTISQSLLKLMSIVSMMPLGTKVLSLVLREKNYSVMDTLAWEDPLEWDMATHSNIFAWRIPMDREAWWAI